MTVRSFVAFMFFRIQHWTRGRLILHFLVADEFAVRGSEIVLHGAWNLQLSVCY